MRTVLQLKKFITVKVTNSCRCKVSLTRGNNTEIRASGLLSVLYRVGNKLQLVRTVPMCHFIILLFCRILYSKQYLVGTKNNESKPQIKWKEIKRPFSGLHLRYLLSASGLSALRRKAHPQALLVLKWLNCPFLILQNNISHLMLKKKSV